MANTASDKVSFDCYRPNCSVSSHFPVRNTCSIKGSDVLIIILYLCLTELGFVSFNHEVGFNVSILLQITLYTSIIMTTKPSVVIVFIKH